ncbi:MAG TPA: ATP-binding protein [Mycobacteriales bacterium]|nr:ATP-binding protein [Mycobacteriales bacterium]
MTSPPPESPGPDPPGPLAGEAVLSLPALRVSVAAARRTVAALCGPAGLEGLCDTAELLTSEVVTNALVHGDGQIQIRAQAAHGRLRVEVQDQGTGIPQPREAGPADEGGRGMRLLAALATGWGVTPVTGGKVVWFELDG